MTWLELLVDFELYTGITCQTPSKDEQSTWGQRALLLKKVVKTLLACRGGGPGALKKDYGCSNRVTSLAPFGQHYAQGLRRRAMFAAGKATHRAVGANAYTWAISNTGESLSKHLTDYTGFKLGGRGEEDHRSRFEKQLQQQAKVEVRRRCYTKTSPLQAELPVGVRRAAGKDHKFEVLLALDQLSDE